MATYRGKTVTRVSRPCYDKFHRCPGWNGGGMRWPKVKRCTDGTVRTYGPAPEYRAGRLWQWRAYTCDNPECTIVVLPYNVRYVDPTYVVWAVKRWFREVGRSIKHKRVRRDLYYWAHDRAWHVRRLLRTPGYRRAVTSEAPLADRVPEQ